MNEHSDETPDWENQRMKIIGLGESSIRKSYYPELQQRLFELEKTNTELYDALEEIQSKEEELRHNYEELRMIQSALDLARKKLRHLNSITFQDIQNALFSLHGYLSLTDEMLTGDTEKEYIEKSVKQMQKIERILHLAKHYQDMGINPPKWQNVMEVLLYAISHLDLSNLKRDIQLEGLVIFTDPLLEDAFYCIMENILVHSCNATEYRVWYQKTDEGVILFIADNGIGVEEHKKQQIFERGYGTDTGLGLFLTREILAITGITCRETGEPGKGARFEILIPEGKYRLLSSPI